MSRGVTVIVLESSCSRCGARGFNWYCRECAAMYCDYCDCFCEDDEDDEEGYDPGHEC